MTEDTFSDCYGDPGIHRRPKNHTTRHHTPRTAHRGVSGRAGQLTRHPSRLCHRDPVFQPAEGGGRPCRSPSTSTRCSRSCSPSSSSCSSARPQRPRQSLRSPCEAAPARARVGDAAPGRARGPRVRARRAGRPDAWALPPNGERRAHAETAFLEGMWARRRAGGEESDGGRTRAREGEAPLLTTRITQARAAPRASRTRVAPTARGSSRCRSRSA